MLKYHTIDEEGKMTPASSNDAACLSELNTLLSADFDLERLIAARKMRTHCRKYTVDELLDEVVALYNKYYLPDIEKLKDAAGS